MEPIKKARKIASLLDGKKAADLLLLDVRGVTLMADYFMICTGNSTPHIRALCDEVIDRMTRDGIAPMKVEGMQSATWILIDFGDVIVHIFNKEARKFYNLEGLWADAARIDICEVVKEQGL